MSALEFAIFRFGPMTYEVSGTPFALHNPGHFNQWSVFRNGARDEKLTVELERRTFGSVGSEIAAWLREVHASEQQPKRAQFEATSQTIYNLALGNVGGVGDVRGQLSNFVGPLPPSRRVRITLEEIK